MIPKEELRKIIILEHLTDEMLEKIAPAIQLLQIKEQEMVFEEGSEARQFYMLKSGKILLEKRISSQVTVSLGAIKPGFSFGWSAMFGEPYSFLAISSEESEIFTIAADSILTFLDNDHSMGFQIMRSLTRMLKNRMNRIEEQFLRAIREHPDIESLLS
ncbi:Crp/Fnr family transcriptional regulator [bacterium]|nr:Crp/Fnr family transcriptional regulator [bacterium]